MFNFVKASASALRCVRLLDLLLVRTVAFRFVVSTPALVVPAATSRKQGDVALRNLKKLMRRWLSAAALLGLCLLPMAGGAQEEYLVYFVGAQDSALLGARQGISEAQLQGRFLQQDYRLVQFTDAAALPRPIPAVAIVTNLPAAPLLQLARERADVPVFNVGADEDSLRTACLPNLLHVQPSQRMKADALAQWRERHPQSKARAQAWHHGFKKFAARDLNKRFRKAFDTAMDDAAWAGWAAVKMASDLLARGTAGDANTLLRQLRTALTFDGQKGDAMDFRANGQLRQLVLLVEDDRPVGEAPLRGKTLDSLGTDGACP